MRGSIREKRAGVWELRVELPNDPVMGARRQKYSTVKGPKRKELFELQKLLVNTKDAKARASSASVEYVIGAWYEASEGRLTRKTASDYEWRLRRNILPTLGKIPADELTPAHIDKLYRELEAKGDSPAGIRQTHAILRPALNQAVKWGWLESTSVMCALNFVLILNR